MAMKGVVRGFQTLNDERDSCFFEILEVRGGRCVQLHPGHIGLAH
jgi:hypothetical protein